eukprot:242639-Prymnesium_polylepis.1
MRRLDCPTDAPSPAAPGRIVGAAGVSFAVRVRLLICPEACIGESRTSCDCPVLNVSAGVQHEAIHLTTAATPPPSTSLAEE